MIGEIVPCKKCKNKPSIKEIGGMFYAQCRCDKWDPYEHLGITYAACARNWNLANTRNQPAELIQ